jgi:hypothetical protein
MKDDEIPTYQCFLCQRTYKFGFHKYEGRSVPHLAMNICQRCERANWDGIVPNERIMAHFAKHGIVPRLNKKGWIDIPPIGAPSN